MQYQRCEVRTGKEYELIKPNVATPKEEIMGQKTNVR